MFYTLMLLTVPYPVHIERDMSHEYVHEGRYRYGSGHWHWQECGAWGAGRGFDPTEFHVFGVPPEESALRFREAVAIVLAAWQNERLTWDGRYWHFADIEVLPKPLQQPHPPIWVAAGSPEAVCWAGSQGHSIMLGPHTHYSDIARMHEMHRKELETHGHTLAGRDIPITRLIAVAETEQAVKDI
jgi:alkanesulfonate monooxygenase SsuD/methylene tetrahydromethanopterin reductase-like flavin-dependent oxidoreductase (luciferase family)